MDDNPVWGGQQEGIKPAAPGLGWPRHGYTGGWCLFSKVKNGIAKKVNIKEWMGRVVMGIVNRVYG